MVPHPGVGAAPLQGRVWDQVATVPVAHASTSAALALVGVFCTWPSQDGHTLFSLWVSSSRSYDLVNILLISRLNSCICLAWAALGPGSASLSG